MTNERRSFSPISIIFFYRLEESLHFQHLSQSHLFLKSVSPLPTLPSLPFHTFSPPHSLSCHLDGCWHRCLSLTPSLSSPPPTPWRLVPLFFHSDGGFVPQCETVHHLILRVITPTSCPHTPPLDYWALRSAGGGWWVVQPPRGTLPTPTSHLPTPSRWCSWSCLSSPSTSGIGVSNRILCKKMPQSWQFPSKQLCVLPNWSPWIRPARVSIVQVLDWEAWSVSPSEMLFLENILFLRRQHLLHWGATHVCW